MQRILEPELLDSLAPDHPEALRNRRDLRLTNAIMRNHAWFLRTLPALVQPGERTLEVGAGDGELAAKLRQRGLAVDGLDLWPQPPDWPAAVSQWHRTDVRRFDQWNAYPIVFGNLIFHQFAAEELRSIGQNLGRTRVVLACEPMRRRSSQIAYRLIAPLLGANRVTLHDARVSIQAGFQGWELPQLLGLQPDRWEVHCTTHFIGAYRMIAIRRP